MLEFCGSFLLWRFLPVVGVERVAGPQLGKPVLVFWWVELDFFSLESNEVPSSEF